MSKYRITFKLFGKEIDITKKSKVKEVELLSLKKAAKCYEYSNN